MKRVLNYVKSKYKKIKRKDLLDEINKILKELEDFEEMLNYIGDYSIIKEVSQYIIEQRIKAEEAKIQAEEDEEFDYDDDYDMYDPYDMSTWDDNDWINFELEH